MSAPNGSGNENAPISLSGKRDPAGYISGFTLRASVTELTPLTSLAGLEIKDQAGVFIEADGVVLFGNLFPPFGEALHADETATGVEVHATFSIVPVWDKGNMHAEISKEIQPIHRVDILPNLVDLIDRQSMGGDRDRGGRSKHQRSAEAVLRAGGLPFIIPYSDDHSVIDNYLDTRWATYGIGEYIQFDLGSRKAISAVSRAGASMSSMGMCQIDDGTWFSSEEIHCAACLSVRGIQKRPSTFRDWRASILQA